MISEKHELEKPLTKAAQSAWRSARVVRCNTSSVQHHHHRPIVPAPHPRNLSTLQNGRVRLPSSFRRAFRLRRAREEPPSLCAPIQSSALTTRSWIYRENRVPSYQKEFQKHDGVRLWMKVRDTLHIGLVA